MASAGVDLAVARAVAAVLVVAAVPAGLLAALATVEVVVPAGWWEASVAASALVSLAMMVLFFSPGLLLGVAIDVVLLAVVVTGAWSPGE